MNPSPPPVDRQVNKWALIAAIVAAALATAGAVVAILTNPDYPGTRTIFIFVFLYALIPGLIAGIPILGYMIGHDEFRWWTAALGGALAAAVPGILFLVLIANCRNNGVVLGIETCTDGVRNGEAWKLSAMLIGGMMGIGASAGVIGFTVYRLLAGGRTRQKAPAAP